MNQLTRLFRLLMRFTSRLSLFKIHLPQAFTGRKKGAHYTVKNFFLTPSISI